MTLFYFFAAWSSTFSMISALILLVAVNRIGRRVDELNRINAENKKGAPTDPGI